MCRIDRRSVSISRSDHEDEGASLEDQLPDDSPLAEDALDRLQQLDLVRTGLDQLDAHCRDLLQRLFRNDGDRPACDDVACRLAVPVGRIGPTRSRCLAKLRCWLEAQNVRVDIFPRRRAAL